MAPRRSTFVRAVGLSLLLLALSPVTAPFSTCDVLQLVHLFGGTGEGGAIVQEKAPTAEAAAEVRSAAPVDVAGRGPDVLGSLHPEPAPPLARAIPLRI